VGIVAAIAVEEDGPQLRLPGGTSIPLGDRFDLSGSLRANVPDAILLGPAAPDLVTLPAASHPAATQAIAWDNLVVSQRSFFVEGWMDDRFAPLDGFRLEDRVTGERVGLPAYRLRRPDVENYLQSSQPFEFGIWTAGRVRPGFEPTDLDIAPLGPRGAQQMAQLPDPIRKPDSEFLDFLLAHLGNRGLLGELTTRSFADLDAGHGAMLAALHDDVAATRATRIEATFGPRSRGCRLSLVCVLLGIPDFLYLLVSQFARFGPLDAFEFVFVNNSPELEEVLVRDAELASFVFGARIVLVSLNQNCGFSYANNVGVTVAQAGTVGIINPDVYPRDAAAVAHILRLAESNLGSDVVGGKLYYADGSVMHDGMFFAPDVKISALAGAPVWTVEHFRKGFPDTAGTEPRRVPAVTGALMLIEKALFERIGGFDPLFISGYYEDADLCLRVRQGGGNVRLDPALAYWHYEGMGSAKRPARAGAQIYNRWLFTRRWGATLERANDV
jgi:GT2 family glycosyltransferase